MFGTRGMTLPVLWRGFWRSSTWVIGLAHLRAIHMNDSKNPLGARKDRHACLGEGCIGLEALKRVATHPALHHLPMILETPNELPGYAREIQLLRQA